MASRDDHDNWLTDRGARIAELAAIVLAVLGVLLLVDRPGQSLSWWVVPALLVAAGIVPFAVRGQGPPSLCRLDTVAPDLKLLLWTCAAVFPVTYLLVWLAHGLGISIPLPSKRPSSYVTWVTYQFLYVALAEEVFFRGYVLSTLLHTFGKAGDRPKEGPVRGDWAAIAVSAALFSVAHWAVQEGATAALTFLPGVVLGWLFVRTRRLLAPILFHGAANVFWLVVLK
jgi:membrane protease YdiL (CAAX protease family)